MTIDVAPEDHALLEELVDSGRFGSVSEAIHALLHGGVEVTPDEEWKRQLDASIDRGLADVEAGRYRPAEDFMAELKARYGS